MFEAVHYAEVVIRNALDVVLAGPFNEQRTRIPWFLGMSEVAQGSSTQIEEVRRRLIREHKAETRDQIDLDRTTTLRNRPPRCVVHDSYYRLAWSVSTVASAAVIRVAVGRCRYSLGPWALASGPSAPVTTNWVSRNR